MHMTYNASQSKSGHIAYAAFQPIKDRTTALTARSAMT
jgi:hypothetical protein